MDEYIEARKYILSQGWKIKEWDEPRAVTSFVEKVVYLTKHQDSRFRESLLIHEAHHVETCRERQLRHNPFKYTHKEIVDWIIEDETQAYTKQYEYLSKFNPRIRTTMKPLIRAYLGFYYRKEAMESALRSRYIMSLFNNEDEYKERFNKDWSTLYEGKLYPEV